MRPGEQYKLTIKSADQEILEYTGELLDLGETALLVAEAISEKRGAVWNITQPKVIFELQKIADKDSLIAFPALDGGELAELQQLVPAGSALPWLMTVAGIADRKQVGLQN